MGPLPAFLVIGAQKSGTTSLLHSLGAHPELCCPDQPVYFFDRHAERGLEWYRAQFAGGESALAVGEGSPNYMYFDDIPPAMAAAVPDARLIAVLRNPVDRAYSHYWHNRTRGHEPLEFADAIAAEPERITRDRDALSRYSYLDRGRYAHQLRHVCEHFPRSNVLVLLTDDLRRNRGETLARLYRFLGADEAFVPPEPKRPKNAFVVYRSQRLRRPIRRLPAPVDRIAGRLNIRYTTYSPMPPAVRERLVARFEGPVAELGAWLGRDLSGWLTSG